MSVAIVCPTCQRTCRTNREIRADARIRCPECGGVSRVFLHANGAVELRPADPPSPPGAALGLPPRVGESATDSRRTILTSRRKNRPLGGYLPFEKSRSYIGVFVFFGLLGIGSLAAYWYSSQVATLNKATEQAGTLRGNVWRLSDEKKRKDFQLRQKRAMDGEARKKAGQADATPRTQDKSPAEPKP
jgi:DNA-directed RNA polymerase subunit RPC12/RpoP